MTVDMFALTRLLPMNLILGPEGEILGSGPTMRKLIGEARSLHSIATLQRPHPKAPGAAGTIAALRMAAQTGERIFLRIDGPRPLVLRGHAAVMGGCGRLLVNLGFGIGLVDAVRDLGLTDADFAPDDLAMELLFLHEANRAVLAELSGVNLRLEEARRTAEMQAFTDALTGLANRRAFELAIERAMAGLTGDGAADDPMRDFALAHIDLDRFKAVNDGMGHAAGDAVLCRVAELMRKATRAQDTVARIGGDEFVLILPGLTCPEALESLLARMIAQIGRRIDTPAGPARVSASIGVALSPDYRGQPAAQMLRDADLALYAAKRAGRGCWRLAVRPSVAVVHPR